MRSPFYPFTNLAVAIPKLSDEFSYDNFGNPIVVASSSLTTVLLHVEEETNDDTEIPKGLRDLFNYGVDAYLLRGYVTDNQNTTQLLDTFQYFQNCPAIYKSKFFQKNYAQIGVVQFHKILQPAFNENAITGDAVQLTFTPKEIPDNSDVYIELADRLGKL